MSKVYRLFVAAAMLMCSVFAANAQEVEFPYPDMPDALTQPEQRLEYMLCHFWDNYSFDDTSSKNLKVGEQGFVDFLELLKYADGSLAERAVEKYLAVSAADSTQLSNCEEMIDHYLGVRESPMRDDCIYAVFLAHLAKIYEESKPAYSNQLLFKRNNVMKNQEGTVVSDFVYKDEKGHTIHLYDSKAQVIIIDFHDPDCKECRMVEERMKDEPLLHNQAIVLLKIHPEDATPQFYIPSTPTFYILDSNFRIIKKDITYEQLRAFLMKNEEFNPD